MPMSRIDVLFTEHDLPANQALLLLREFIDERELEEDLAEWLEDKLAEDDDSDDSDDDDQDDDGDDQDDEEEAEEAEEGDEEAAEEESASDEPAAEDWTDKHKRSVRRR